MSGQTPIVMFSGVPGAGKSSLARAWAEQWPFGLHLPVDDIRELVVSGIAHPVPEWTAETGRQFALARQGAATLAGIYARAGFAVAIDDVVGAAELHSAFGAYLPGQPLYGVLLHPRLEIALQRNASRSTKPFDTALLAPVIARLHQETQPAAYLAAGWHVLDTSELSLAATLAAINELVGRPG